MAVHLAVAGDAFDGVLFCAVLFSHEMSGMRYEEDIESVPEDFPYLLMHVAHISLTNILWRLTFFIA